jgi:hypothetical protein
MPAEDIDSASVTVDGTSKTLSGPSDSATVQLDGDSSVEVSSVSATGGDQVTAQVSYQETTYTTDPSVEIDGQKANYSGTLGSGESANVSVNGLSSGNNTLYFDQGTLSSDAPPHPGVDWTLSYGETHYTDSPSVSGDVSGSYSGQLAPGETATISLSGMALGSNSMSFEMNGPAPVGWEATVNESYNTLSPAVDVGSDGDQEQTHVGELGPGETVSYSLPSVTRNVSELTVQTENGTEVITTIRLRERTTTPSVELTVNGKTAEIITPLADGETASLSVNESWIQEGQNQVDVTVGDGTLSSDAPEPAVDLVYKHGTQDTIQTSYSATGWRESYNVSTTYASRQENPTLEVPFASNVYEIDQLEARVGGGSWSSVASERYSLSGNTLLVELQDGDTDGDVDAGTTVDVRVTGHRVRVMNGEISVSEPTTPGDPLDSEITVESASDGFGIGVEGSPRGDRIHYAYNPSWSNADHYSRVDADGDQTLRFPQASAGGKVHVTTIPVQVLPRTGEARVRVPHPDQPTVAITSGSSTGDDLEIRYLQATAGEYYELYSVPRKRVMDTAQADGTSVVLVEDDSNEALAIRVGDGSSSAGTGGGGGFPTDVSSKPPMSRPEVLLGLFAALMILLAWGTQRAGITGRTRWGLLAAVGLGGSLIALEALNPGSISARLGVGLQDGVPLVVFAVIAYVGYSVYSWWQSRRASAGTPETKVTFDLGRDR